MGVVRASWCPPFPARQYLGVAAAPRCAVDAAPAGRWWWWGSGGRAETKGERTRKSGREGWGREPASEMLQADAMLSEVCGIAGGQGEQRPAVPASPSSRSPLHRLRISRKSAGCQLPGTHPAGALRCNQGQQHVREGYRLLANRRHHAYLEGKVNAECKLVVHVEGPVHISVNDRGFPHARVAYNEHLCPSHHTREFKIVKRERRGWAQTSATGRAARSLCNWHTDPSLEECRQENPGMHARTLKA